MNEALRIDRWIVDQLEADVAVGGLFHVATPVGTAARVSGVWSEQIPAGRVLPAIRFSDLSPDDVTSFNGYRILITGLYLVAVVVEGADYGPAVLAADRVDQVLHRAAGPAVDGVMIESCVRESVFRQPEIDGDIAFRHLGGLYRIQASKS